MISGSPLIAGVRRGLLAVKSLFVKSPRSLRGEELRQWINAQPHLVEETKAGFKDIDEGRYSRIPPRQDKPKP
jgi:hypothetical protein